MDTDTTYAIGIDTVSAIGIDTTCTLGNELTQVSAVNENPHVSTVDFQTQESLRRPPMRRHSPRKLRSMWHNIVDELQNYNTGNIHGLPHIVQIDPFGIRYFDYTWEKERKVLFLQGVEIIVDKLLKDNIADERTIANILINSALRLFEHMPTRNAFVIYLTYHRFVNLKFDLGKIWRDDVTNRLIKSRKYPDFVNLHKAYVRGDQRFYVNDPILDARMIGLKQLHE